MCCVQDGKDIETWRRIELMIALDLIHYVPGAKKLVKVQVWTAETAIVISFRSGDVTT
jgi:hypothetical protein